MTSTVLVRVLDADRPLEDRTCRLLRLRDGRQAAVWRGLAYPLRDDGAIDVAGPGIAPAECLPPARDVGTTEQSLRWGIVEGAEEAWILLAGTVTDRDGAASHLRGAGLAVLRSGAWLGDPVDGFAADWFVRIARPPGGGELRRLIEGVLGHPFGVPQAVSEASEGLRQRLVRSELERLRTEAVALRGEVARLRADAGSAAELVARIATLEAALDDANRELAKERATPAAVVSTASPAVEAPASAQASPRLARRLQDEVAAVLETLLPGMQLLRDSLVVASGEFRDRSGFYRALRELSQGGPRLPPAWKKLRGMDDWWERHVSNGEDDAGRVYARASRGGLQWSVLLSHKGDQERDLVWLRRTICHEA
ncbi:hypothetical protein KPL78_13890 [Roseomonas sp. HJA6]|uniref:Uncharacterized protein n=1 Tax=Roseomonas alba TaxID=2846776 RepID=A0ABS7A9H3_9PROT|nr:hypothetical protein [Neoroseomonas alba]MBW6398951.1 hypothetical protein [Neoroseomonas alba]